MFAAKRQVKAWLGASDTSNAIPDIPEVTASDRPMDGMGLFPLQTFSALGEDAFWSEPCSLMRCVSMYRASHIAREGSKW